MLSADDVDVQMEDRLAALGTLVDHSSVALLGQALLCRDFGDDDHHVAQKCGMSILSLADASETVAVLGDDQKVLGGDGGDVLECQALVIFVDDVGWDLLANNLVENRIFYSFSAACCVCHG